MYNMEKHFIRKAHPEFTETEILAYIMGFKEYEEGIKKCEDEIEKLKKQLTQLAENTVGTAKWLINSDGYYPYCSRCMNEPPSGILTKYCPECGAKMEE